MSKSDSRLSVTVLSFASSAYYVTELCRGLVETDQIEKLNVILPDDSNELKTLSESPNVFTFERPETLPKIIVSSFDPQFIFEILSKINQAQPDIIHVVNELRAPPHIVGLLSRKCPTILTVHEPSPYLQTWKRKYLLNPIQKGNLKLLSRLTDTQLVHGERLKDHLEELTSSQDVRVVKHGSLARFFTRWKDDNVSTDGDLVLFFGRIFPGKGIGNLIESMERVWDELPGVELVIAGSGDTSDYPIEEHDQITLINEFVSEECAAELFQRASVVAMPYIDGSASGIISIAGGFETPVVATSVGNFDEVLEDGFTGYTVPPENSKDFADRLIKLLDNDDLCREMGLNLSETQNKNYDWVDIGENNIDIYQNIIETRSS